MKKLIIRQWEIYNMVKIINEVEPKWSQRIFQCQCECWNIKNIQLWNLRNWKTKSCGCFQWKTHGMESSRIYYIWHSMKQRCKNINNIGYSNYGWRWITYDKKWENFVWFYEDMKDWYEEHLTIDRIDSNWNYSKENCKWATSKEQNRNKRNNILFKWKCLSEWREFLWITKGRFDYLRYNRKLSLEEIFYI